MAEILVITDGAYGHRIEGVVNSFGKKNTFLKMHKIDKPSNMIVDEIEFPKEVLENINKADIMLLYTQHPDNTYYLCETAKQLNENIAIIVATWGGEGEKNELKSFDAVCPDEMCMLDEDEAGDLMNKYPKLREFLDEFGSPKVKLTIKNNSVESVEVLRTSICGSTIFMADLMKNMEFSEIEGFNKQCAMLIQRYPCVAGKIKLFRGDCKKQEAMNVHKNAIINGLNKL
ncbi:hypothetical protein HNP92_001700 [Methanococcus maripaludis]|uniref:Thymidylate synthase n=1 Tax=Methanococcus maripaludis TaxID=39152 RepID=A0A7J9PRJ7_METMI|nr:DUF166 family protein [Methanococcus maripaludis]MBA2868794.1 hypothetical protein [Methanococcus maripaludis]MBB6402378.1 hypothetical protein [Methanococcus maripaludis]